MDLNELIVFARVVEARSFTAAARLLGIPKSTLSRKVSALEERLGSQLLSRTTRTLSLTDVGEVYYEHCARVVAEVDAAERAVGALSERPMGRLRVTAPLGFSFLGPAIAGFGARHPEVEVEVTSTDRVVDLVSERFDVAIRAGPLVDSTLIAKPLGGSPQVLVASKRWVRARGALGHPRDLEGDDWVFFTTNARVPRVELSRGREKVTIAPRPRLRVNDVDLLKSVLEAGQGVSVLASFLCEAELAAGRLVRVLPEWQGAPTLVHAIYPSTRHVSAKVRAFVDALVEAFASSPARRVS